MNLQRCLLTILMLSPAVAHARDEIDVWRRQREAVLKNPAVVRYYDFEQAKVAQGVVPDILGKSEPLRLEQAGKQPRLAVVAGRWPGKKAVRLDREVLAGPPLTPASGFSIVASIRVDGLGSIEGDSVRDGATLFSVGNGYWEGFRTTVRLPDCIYGFEIGRPQPSHSIGISSLPQYAKAWSRLAATWDGRQMRLYLDGRPIARAPFAGPWTPAPGGKFRIGFNGSGWGSARLDVDEVIVYGTALSPIDALRDAHFPKPLPEEAAKLFAAADEAMGRQDMKAAVEGYSRLFKDGSLHVDYRAAAGLMLLPLGSPEQTNAVPAAIAELPGVAPSHRRMALAALVRQMRGAAPPVSPGVLRELLDESNGVLGPRDRIVVTLQLARQLRDGGDSAGAQQQYAAVAQSPQATPRERLDVRLEFAHAAVAAGKFDVARKLYVTVIESPEAVPPYRSLAQLQLAASFVREKNYAAAKAEFEKVAAMADAPEHHKQEAKERLAEIARVESGRPAVDPAASRTVLPKRPAAGVEFHVSPAGSDANPGTGEKPFATLERARDAVRELKRAKKLPPGGAAVLMAGGVYPRVETFRLSAEDTGTAESPIVYRSVPGATPVLYGGKAIGGFKPVDDPAILARLPEEARGKVYWTDLKAQGIADFGKLQRRGFGQGSGPMFELYCDGRPMTLARWPNEGFVRTGKVRDDGSKPDRRVVFEYEGDRPNRWRQAPDAWVFGYWQYLWADASLGVASIDTAARQLRLADPYTYGGVREGMPYFVYNLLEEIDRPGEWYLDRTAGRLYFYPPRNPAECRMEVPLLTKPFVETDGVSHLAIEGLTFEMSQGDGLKLNGGQQCLIAGCTVRRIGGDAISVAGSRHAIVGCDLHTLGRGGMKVHGGDRKTLTPSGHVVENNHVWEFSRIDRTYTPALWVDGVAVRIAHNRFHGSSCHAARLEGNDHLIEFNEVFDVVRESDDQGGMEMFGNPTYRGVVFRYNYFHDIGSPYDWPCGAAGIRLDDAICGVLIHGNVFQRCAVGQFGAVQIHGGKENVVENNLFLDCRYGVSFSSWGPARWKQFLASPQVAGLLKDAAIDRPPYSTCYPALARLAEKPDVNCVWRNLSFGGGPLLFRDHGNQDAAGNVANSQGKGLVDPSDPAVPRPTAAALEAAGLRPIPFDQIGLYVDGYRQAK